MSTAISLSDALREAAREHHRRLERAIDVSALVTCREDYAALLARLLGFVAPLEERLAHFDELRSFGYALEDRCKAPAIIADLATLGWHSHQLLTLPRCNDLPPIRTTGEALGGLYVLEESTFDAHAAAVLAHIWVPHLPMGLVSLHREAQRSHLSDVFAAMRAYEQAAEHTNDVVRSARATFGAFESWLIEYPRRRNALPFARPHPPRNSRDPDQPKEKVLQP